MDAKFWLHTSEQRFHKLLWHFGLLGRPYSHAAFWDMVDKPSTSCRLNHPWTRTTSYPPSTARLFQRGWSHTTPQITSHHMNKVCGAPTDTPQEFIKTLYQSNRKINHQWQTSLIRNIAFRCMLGCGLSQVELRQCQGAFFGLRNFTIQFLMRVLQTRRKRSLWDSFRLELLRNTN